MPKINFFILFFIYFFVHANCEQNKSHYISTSGLGSIREYPSLLHKCTGTFIRPDVLITTARCLYCDSECNLFVSVLTDNEIKRDEALERSYGIQKIELHPEYERDPQRNDIGMAFLFEMVPEISVRDLQPDAPIPMGTHAYTYSWRSSTGVFKPLDYQVEIKKGRIISNAVCSIALNKFVDCNSVCGRGDAPFLLGVFDQGTPLIGQVNYTEVLMGMFVREGLLRDGKVEVFQSMRNLLPWLYEKLDENPPPPFRPPLIPSTTDAPAQPNPYPKPIPNPNPNPEIAPSPNPHPDIFPSPNPHPDTFPSPNPSPETYPRPNPHPHPLPSPLPNPNPNPYPNPLPSTNPNENQGSQLNPNQNQEPNSNPVPFPGNDLNSTPNSYTVTSSEPSPYSISNPEPNPASVGNAPPNPDTFDFHSKPISSSASSDQTSVKETSNAS